MERIRSLGRYQKAVLLATALMALVFTAVYLTVTARVGFAFGDAILLDVHEVSADVYTGKVRGETVRFTVNADRSVTFQRGERLYGPYTAAEDPTAVPADSALAAYMTGVELRRGGEVVFRGGVQCGCGSSDYGIHVRRDAVDLTCSRCGARLRIPAATDEDLDRLCCQMKLVIPGK